MPTETVNGACCDGRVMIRVGIGRSEERGVLAWQTQLVSNDLHFLNLLTYIYFFIPALYINFT